MWLPNWLYTSLPFIYSLAGGVAIYYANHPVGYASGVLLILTALLVFKLRKDSKARYKRR
jgi:hypothetical protein